MDEVTQIYNIYEQKIDFLGKVYLVLQFSVLVRLIASTHS